MQMVPREDQSAGDSSGQEEEERKVALPAGMEVR